MNIFLKLKHWQVFLIWILGTVQLFFFMNSDVWFISFGLYFALFLIWIYSIGKVLNKNTALNNRMTIWWILYLVSITTYTINAHDLLTHSYERIDTWIIIFAGIIGFIAIIKIAIYSAKAIKKAECNKEYKTVNLISELFLICFFIIGIWILQPRLNKIMAKKQSSINNNIYN